MVESPVTRGRLWRVWLVELFAFANLAFLSFDVYLAHSVNDFGNPLEWAPVPFGLLALLLVPGLAAPQRGGWPRTLGYVVGIASMGLGIAGLLFHLEGAFFQQQTIRSLVYAAPFIAPLAYVGVGMLLVVNRLEGRDAAWSSWVLMLAAGGFLGNFALSLLDHAQNGFFAEVEWIGVAAGAFGFAFLLLVVQRPFDRVLWNWCCVVMVVAVVVGVLGAGLHLAANAHVPADSWWDRMIYGAPVFAPLLFCNLALLAAIGLWDLAASLPGANEASTSEPTGQPPAAGRTRTSA
jgi:hypothetical protein